MGRTQAFDTAVVVRAARGVFWESGYDATALPDLERATGLGRSSIYNAFGSKRGLFDAAVESYLTEVIRPRLQPLMAESVAETAIVDHLTATRDALLRAGSLPATSGCLLINAASASIGKDAVVARTIADYRSELRRAIGRGVDARMPEADAAERRRIADACTGLVVAAFALVRIDQAQAAAAIDTALELVAASR